MLINPYWFAAGGGGAPVDAFISASESTANTTAYTFTNHQIGTAHASRIVVVGIVVYDTGNNDVASVTIGGSAATLATSTGSLLGTARVAAIYYRAVAAGTTATIVVNCTNSAESCGIAVWSLYPTSATPVDTGESDAAGLTQSGEADISVTAGGTVVAVSMHNNANTSTWSWQGSESVAENVDEQLGDSGINWTACTIPISVTSSTNDITVTWTTAANGCCAVASWGP